jgi:hypothetical protein
MAIGMRLSSSVACERQPAQATTPRLAPSAAQSSCQGARGCVVLSLSLLALETRRDVFMVPVVMYARRCLAPVVLWGGGRIASITPRLPHSGPLTAAVHSGRWCCAASAFAASEPRKIASGVPASDSRLPYLHPTRTHMSPSGPAEHTRRARPVGFAGLQPAAAVHSPSGLTPILLNVIDRLGRRLVRAALGVMEK